MYAAHNLPRTALPDLGGGKLSWRWLPPAHSPLGLPALVAGARAALLPRSSHHGRLEAMLRERFGCRPGAAVLLVDSGTSALALAIRAALSGRQDAAVALPAYGCYDLATAADAAPARVILYDLDPVTLGPEPASLRRALAAGAGAVVIAHLFGIPVELGPLRGELRAAGVVLIEDVAQASGATLRGLACGVEGPLTVLSFGRGKGWTGSGGGALLAIDGECAERVTAARPGLAPSASGVRPVAMGVLQYIAGRPALYALPASVPALGLGRTVYHAPHEPRAMSAASAAIAAVTGSAVMAEAELRRRNAVWLAERLPDALQALRIAEGAAPSWLRLPLVADAATAARADGSGAHALGIYRGYPLSLADLAGFDRVVNRDDEFGGARTLAARLITAPVHSQLTERDLGRVAAWLAGSRSAPAAPERQ